MRYALDQAPQVEGALVAIETETGQVKALVGGVDFQRSQFNRAVLARRQPGSAFKPFIYAAAIDHGYTAATIVQDAPISRLDLLVCRNILMYFNAETQSKILARLHFALGASGYLFLGNAEMLITHTNLFRSVNLTHRVFARTPKAAMRDRLLVLAQAGDVEVANQLGQQIRLREAAFDAGPVAQVVVDPNGELVLAGGLVNSSSVRALVDEASYRRDGSINVLRLVKHRCRP